MEEFTPGSEGARQEEFQVTLLECREEFTQGTEGAGLEQEGLEPEGLVVVSVGLEVLLVVGECLSVSAHPLVTSNSILS